MAENIETVSVSILTVTGPESEIWGFLRIFFQQIREGDIGGEKKVILHLKTELNFQIPVNRQSKSQPEICSLYNASCSMNSVLLKLAYFNKTETKKKDKLNQLFLLQRHFSHFCFLPMFFSHQDGTKLTWMPHFSLLLWAWTLPDYRRSNSRENHNDRMVT